MAEAGDNVLDRDVSESMTRGPIGCRSDHAQLRRTGARRLRRSGK